MKIQIVLFDGFGELVSFAPFEVLKRDRRRAPFTVEFVSSEPKQEVTTSFGVTVQSHEFYEWIIVQICSFSMFNNLAEYNLTLFPL